jgi:hypothetical protein
MIIITGTRFYGRIRACGSSFVATKFAHVYFLPLIPVSTHVVFEETGDGSVRGVAAPLSFKSVMAAYLRVWGPIAALAAIFFTVAACSEFEEEPLALVVAGAFGAVVVLAFVAATVLGYAVVGKLSHDEKRQRAVYALHTGYPVDPADMGEARQPLRESLMHTIAERARGLAALGYRASADPTQAWPQIALDPTHHDESLLTAAFTLARLDGSLAHGPSKAHLGLVHGQLWQRIVQGNPPYLQGVA